VRPEVAFEFAKMLGILIDAGNLANGQANGVSAGLFRPATAIPYGA
jgi:hypothetical protein